jgi:hypothetical protein
MGLLWDYYGIIMGLYGIIWLYPSGIYNI